MRTTMNDDVRVIVEDLPTTVNGFVYHDCDGNPIIVLNARMPFEKRQKTYEHEKDHILNEELDDLNYLEYGNG